MSSQERPVDEENAGRAEKGSTGSPEKEALDFNSPLVAQRVLEFNFQTPQHPAVDTLVQLGPQIKQLERERLSRINDLERQVRDLGYEIQRLNSENRKLRAKPSAEDGASSNTFFGKDDQDYLAKELEFVYKIASELGLTLEKPTDHRQLPILCGVICNEKQLTHLKIFMGVYSSHPFENGCFFCLGQDDLGFMPRILPFGEGGLRCQAHGDVDSCVWISKREGRWVIGTSELTFAVFKVL